MLRRSQERDTRLRDYRFDYDLPYAYWLESRILSSDDDEASRYSADIWNTSILRPTDDDDLPTEVRQARDRLDERLERGLRHRGIRHWTPRGTWVWLPPEEATTMTNSGGLDSYSLHEPFEFGLPQIEPPVSFQNAGSRPAGLGLDAVDGLQREVFKDATVSGTALPGEIECSVCLEKFSDGDQLIRLSCSHRFHLACLLPWIRTCGNCPYCRTVVMTDKQQQQIKAAQIH